MQRSPASPSSLLPPEVLLGILELLDKGDLATLRITRKSFQTVVQDNQLWERIFSEEFPNEYKDFVRTEHETQWFEEYKITASSEYRKLTPAQRVLFSKVKRGELSELNVSFADLLVGDKHNKTLLCWARYKDYQHMLNHFYHLAVTYFATHKRDKRKRTILHWALLCRQPLDTIQSLLADVTLDHDAVDAAGNSALHYATSESSIDIFNALYQQCEKHVANKKGAFILHAAAEAGAADKAETILNDPAVAVNAAYYDTATTPLILAAANGHVEVVNKLLLKNAQAELADHKGVTPLFIAAQNGHLLAVQRLLAVPGLRLDLPVKGNQTALTIAIRNQHIAVAEALVRAGANIRGATLMGIDLACIPFFTAPLTRANLSAQLINAAQKIEGHHQRQSRLLQAVADKIITECLANGDKIEALQLLLQGTQHPLFAGHPSLTSLHQAARDLRGLIEKENRVLLPAYQFFQHPLTAENVLLQLNQAMTIIPPLRFSKDEVASHLVTRLIDHSSNMDTHEAMKFLEVAAQHSLFQAPQPHHILASSAIHAPVGSNFQNELQRTIKRRQAGLPALNRERKRICRSSSK